MSSGEDVTPKRKVVKIKPRRVPPKPKLVPKAPATTTTSVTGEPHEGGALVDEVPKESKKRPSPAYDDDDDDVFFTRSTSFARKIMSKDTSSAYEEFRKEEQESLTAKDESGPGKPRRPKKSRDPEWTRSMDAVTIAGASATADLTDSSLSDDDEVVNVTNARNFALENEDPIDRELSLTPPPKIDRAHVRAALVNVEQTLAQYCDNLRGSEAPAVTDASPIPDVDLDPELISIAEQSKQASNRHNARLVPDPDAKVEILVRASRHPGVEITDENRAAITQFEKPLKYIMRVEDNFEQMVAHYSQQKKISKEDLVLTYKKVRVFPRGTPASLGMGMKAAVEAYTKDTYNYITSQHERRLREMSMDGAMIDQEGFPLDDSDDDSELLHLKLQSKDGSVDKLKLKKSSLVSAIISHYRTIKHLPDNVPVHLSFEGDNLHANDRLDNTELEDGDMIMVKT